MIKNHPHWNEDTWENPDSGMQEDLEAVESRDVEISSVGTIAPSGLSDERLQAYLDSVSVEINGSDTILGAQSGALNKINKELQMTGDTSARLGGVDRSLIVQGQEITKHSVDIGAQGQAIIATDIRVTGAEGTITTHTGQIKNIVEVNIPEVRAIADKAIKDLGDLTPRVAATEQASKMANDSVAALTPKVTAAQTSANKGILDAQAAAEKLTQYQGTNDAAVSDAQSMAIQANAKALAAQEILNENQVKWNDGVTAALQAQSTLNDRQDSWNQAVVDAVNANQAADQAQDMAIQYINDMQGALDRQVTEMTEELKDIQKQLARETESSVFIPYNEKWIRENEDLRIELVNDGKTYHFNVTALRSWVGTVEVNATSRITNGLSVYESTVRVEYDIPREDGSRFISWASDDPRSLLAKAKINPGKQQSKNARGGSFTPARNTWVTISNHTFTPPAETADSYLLFWRVEWSAATHHDFYRMRIIQGGKVIVEQELTKFGPLLPIGPGNRAQWIRAPRAELDPNTPVEFQINSTGEQDSQRNILWSESQISWIEGQ